jgi:threonyl-tRNA synthetase
MSKQKGTSAEELYKMRHSLAHVLAQAVLKLYPQTKLAIGPPVDFGCYYDFLFPKPISSEDLPKIEEEMQRILQEGQTFRCETLSVEEAKKFWKDHTQPFKVELIEDLEREEKVKEVTHYANVDPAGRETFIDLCKGGHVENLREIPADGFTITHLAGAYWRGDEKREQLTRIYVAAFPSKAELEEYLTARAEAAKVDHRILGRELGMFLLSEVVGPGLPMLTPRGAIIRQELEQWIRGELKRRGYSFAYTPHIGRADLYKKSGHLSHFREHMFPIIEADDSDYVLKPMNCPHHVEIYRSESHSYRDLPIRIAEFGTVYRYEKSGEVGGLTRVRGFTQDDAHHFLRPDQIEQEVLGILDLSFLIYRTCGFEEFSLHLSLHDPKNKEKYIGTEENWAVAESALRSALRTMNLSFVEAVGEAAFYGPKIDLVVRDIFGREWQLGTIPQVDYNMPERFDLRYVDADGQKKRPVMMHRAIFGSFERFIGVLIEHFKGHFPLWLSPVQVAILPVAGPHEAYAREIEAQLRDAKVRVIFADHTETLAKRIREGERQRIPYLLVLGDREVKDHTVSLRNVKTKAQLTVSLDEFLANILDDIRERRLTPSFGV